MLANVQDGAGARAAAAEPRPRASGCSAPSCAFLSAKKEPTVEEQAGIYAEVLEAFAGRKVVVRTLDAGSDKPLAFAGHAGRGQPRARRARPADRARPTRACSTASSTPSALAAERTGATPWVMAPMVATVGRGRVLRHRGAASAGSTPGRDGRGPGGRAARRPAARSEVDFLSIGTNDLAQYTMAADRLSAELAALTDPWQPALLALVARDRRAGAAAGKPVGRLRRGGRRPAARLRARRARRHVAVGGGRRGAGGRRGPVPGDAGACRAAAEAASTPSTRPPRATPPGPSSPAGGETPEPARVTVVPGRRRGRRRRTLHPCRAAAPPCTPPPPRSP